jgi:hypothetical protein
MMLAPVLRLALPVALAGTFGLQCAHADIFTWVDASGSINVSNLAPPDNARVIKVAKESPRPAAGDDAAPDATALAQRVRQLEREVELARRPVPPPADYAPTPAYAPMPAAPTIQYSVQYIVEAPQAPMQYAANDYPPANYPPAYNNGCDSTWANCGFGWNPGFYPSGVVVLQQPNFRRGRPSPHGRPTHAAPVLPPLVLPLSNPLGSPLAMPRHSTASFRRG